MSDSRWWRASGCRCLRAWRVSGSRWLRASGSRWLRVLGSRWLRVSGSRWLRASGSRWLRVSGSRCLRASGSRSLGGTPYLQARGGRGARVTQALGRYGPTQRLAERGAVPHGTSTEVLTHFSAVHNRHEADQSITHTVPVGSSRSTRCRRAALSARCRPCPADKVRPARRHRYAPAARPSPRASIVINWSHDPIWASRGHGDGVKRALSRALLGGPRYTWR